MKYFPDHNAAFPATGALPPSGFDNKANIILIRSPVVLIGCALVLLRSRLEWFAPLLNLFAIFYVASNLGLYFIGEAAFRSLRFNAALIALDSLTPESASRPKSCLLFSINSGRSSPLGPEPKAASAWDFTSCGLSPNSSATKSA